MESKKQDCPFCTVPASSIVLTSETAFAIRDGFPVSPGHTLVIPKQHLATLFELSRHEQLELWDFVGRVRDRLVADHSPDGFNIGLNDGVAAGQTVPHVHIHVIPRYHSDVPDPRGGIRWVIPDKVPYWK